MSDDRKKDHIDLALSQSFQGQNNFGLRYEPLLGGDVSKTDITTEAFGARFNAPFWISSMTGGTEKAKNINRNLAKACQEFGLGMGLGSTRSLLDSDERLEDFNVRDFMPDRPLWINLGIAQVDELLRDGQVGKIKSTEKKLQADGLIVHINPIQEWLQPEGDRFLRSPLETLRGLCQKYVGKIIVKEVGQGMGPASLKALSELPINGIELSGLGGTNFAQIERARSASEERRYFECAGHYPAEMIVWLNELMDSSHFEAEVIISGGIKNPMQAFGLRSSLRNDSLIGVAGLVLSHSLGEYEVLQSFMRQFIEDYRFIATYFRR